jgi:hypothetical protein
MMTEKDFDLLRLRRGKELFTVYACKHCMRAWVIPHPIAQWRVDNAFKHTHASNLYPKLRRAKRPLKRSTPLASSGS